MHTLIVRENNVTTQVFVGEHAARLASAWALNEILNEYTWADGTRITDTDLRQPEDRQRVFEQMRTQGLRNPQDIQILQRMVVRIHRGMHQHAMEALAALREDFEVEGVYHTQVHTQILLLSGSGIREFYGSEEVTFTRLDHNLLLQDAHRDLLPLVLENRPEHFLEPDFQKWQVLVEQGEFSEAHQHFKASSVHRTLDIGFEESWERLLTPREQQILEWREAQPPMRAHGPTLFTAAQALLDNNTDHLRVVPADLLERAKAAVELHQQHQRLEAAYLASLDENQDHHLYDQEACRISLELARKHLIPELVRLDPALDQIFFWHTGDHLLDVLPDLHFVGGDSGGYTDLEAKHKSVFLNLADSLPSYPRLFDVGISLMPEAAGQVYQVVVTGTSLHLNTSRSLDDLLKPPGTPQISTPQLLSALREQPRPLSVTPWIQGKKGNKMVLEHLLDSQRILQHAPSPGVVPEDLQPSDAQTQGDPAPSVAASETVSFTEAEFLKHFASVESWEVG